ncbi:MAG: hypothetical protein LBV09_04390 [Deferribacteraceae bacterium]|jgi:alpha-amylase/alpha-mannosidase (GH57 family)|nr:hypothetical protein [Deferribacteraceae bacterium]
MKKLRLSFLWHMHQPYYKDSAEGTFDMPWVYLHALKDYYEMARHIIDTDGRVKATFNYVPSLVMQLRDYENRNVSDSFLIVLRKGVDTLSVGERELLIRQVKMVNYRTMAAEFKRFSEILVKLDAAIPISNAELRDASVLYLLSWTGVFWRTDDLPAALISKGAGFTEEEKTLLLDYYVDKIATIIPTHKELVERGAIEVSCTPMFHPILPLLADFSSAKEAMPLSPMPNVGDGFGDDYKWHISEAVKFHEEAFGKRPLGSWPSEGSVSALVADEYIDNGFRWIASDEDILARSLEINIKSYPDRKNLYRQYYREKEGKRLNIYFRDKQLSDLIGFTYSTWAADAAVDDFMGKLCQIYDACEYSPHVSVILDGENAWEYYPKNASEFFTKLYKRLASEEWITTQTMLEASEGDSSTPYIRLDKLASGSWIYGNFAIWCGHHEKNKGWELLAATKRTMAPYLDKISPELKETILKELHIAEGSDWFWWYGDDHHTIQADQFDRLFRGHLINIHTKLDLPVPHDFFEPIKSTAKSGLIRKPSKAINVNMDGQITDFYEWLGAGEFDLSFDEGSMHSGGGYMGKLYFGYNSGYVCFRLDSEKGLTLPESGTLEIEVESRQKIVVPLKKGVRLESEGVVSYLSKVIEVMVPESMIFSADNAVGVVFYLKDGRNISERAPRYNAVKLEKTDDIMNDWMV